MTATKPCFYATYVHHKSHTDGLGSNREFLGVSLETSRPSHDMVRRYSVGPHSINFIFNLWVRDTNEMVPPHILIGGRKYPFSEKL
jgi:hypothetical protein